MGWQAFPLIVAPYWTIVQCSANADCVRRASSGARRVNRAAAVLLRARVGSGDATQAGRPPGSRGRRVGRAQPLSTPGPTPETCIRAEGLTCRHDTGRHDCWSCVCPARNQRFGSRVCRTGVARSGLIDWRLSPRDRAVQRGSPGLLVASSGPMVGDRDGGRRGWRPMPRRDGFVELCPLSTPGENLTDPPIENLTVDPGDEPQVVATSCRERRRRAAGASSGAACSDCHSSVCWRIR